jgi:hypothetical protein
MKTLDFILVIITIILVFVGIIYQGHEIYNLNNNNKNGKRDFKKG